MLHIVDDSHSCQLGGLTVEALALLVAVHKLLRIRTLSLLIGRRIEARLEHLENDEIQVRKRSSLFILVTHSTSL